MVVAAYTFGFRNRGRPAAKEDHVIGSERLLAEQALEKVAGEWDFADQAPKVINVVRRSRFQNGLRGEIVWDNSLQGNRLRDGEWLYGSGGRGAC